MGRRLDELTKNQLDGKALHFLHLRVYRAQCLPISASDSAWDVPGPEGGGRADQDLLGTWSGEESPNWKIPGGLWSSLIFIRIHC